jgi:ADP-ribose pyrophosphatase YjhB (NUDIX family)
LLEETGLVVEVGAIVEVLDRIHIDSEGRVEYHYVLIDYVCSVVGGTLQSASDAADARWVRRGDLPAFEVNPVTVAVVEKAFRTIAERP